jgi:hypothetical protein
MRSPLQIANAALTKLGAVPIPSFDSPSKEGVFIRQRLMELLSLMLRQHTWAFAKQYVTFSSVAGPDANFPNPWLYQFNLPPDIIKLISITKDGARVEYEQIGQVLYTCVPSIGLRYVSVPAGGDITGNAEVYPDDFAEAAAALIAGELAVTMAASDTMRQGNLNDYSALLRQARFHGSIERGVDEVITADEWVAAHRMSGTMLPNERPLDYPAQGTPFNSGP